MFLGFMDNLKDWRGNGFMCMQGNVVSHELLQDKREREPTQRIK